MKPHLRLHRRSESQLLRGHCAESSAWLRDAATNEGRAERIGVSASPPRARVSTTVNGHHCVRSLVS